MYLLTLLPTLKPLPWPLSVVPPLPPAKISIHIMFLSLLLAKSCGKPGCSLLRGSPWEHLAEGQEKSVRSSLRKLWKGVGRSHTSTMSSGINRTCMGLEKSSAQGPCLLLYVPVKLLWQACGLSLSYLKYLQKGNTCPSILLSQAVLFPPVKNLVYGWRASLWPLQEAFLRVRTWWHCPHQPPLLSLSLQSRTCAVGHFSIEGFSAL